ncbi:hypothetical protein BPO_0062 [Bergeyella porcorum]|uniref:Uncharacterized protein n=1 Tax=Bergeyella porcorum TaxID=1735111 RepID=A0AAU0EZ96_9FLAO
MLEENFHSIFLRVSLQFPCGILPKNRIFWEDLGRIPEELPKKAPKI